MSNSQSESRNSFVRKNATKIFTMRIIQGYQITAEYCTECHVPMMSYRGKTQCEVCEERNNANAAGEYIEADIGGPETAAVHDAKSKVRSKSSSSHHKHRVGGGGGQTIENSHQETRNDENNREKHRWMADSVIVVTEEGVELSPGVWSFESRTSDEIEYDVSDDDDGGFDYSNMMASELASCGDVSDDDEFNTEGERIQLHVHPKNALLLAAIDKLANHQRQQPRMQSVQLHDIVEEENQSNSSCPVFASNSAVTPPSRGNPETHYDPMVDAGAETITVSEVNADIIHDIDNTLASYNNGKAFASQVIQDTNNILNDLVSSKSGAQSVSHSIDGTCVSPPSINGIKMPHFDKLVTSCVMNGSSSNYKTKHGLDQSSTASTMPINSSSAGPYTSSVATPRISTPTSPLARTRVTINKLANGFASTAVASQTRSKPHLSTWDNSKKNAAIVGENTVIDEYNEDPAASSGSATAFNSNQSNELPVAPKAVAENRSENTDDFFSELRHKALMAKAKSWQDKLEADSYRPKRNISLEVEVAQHEDGSALEDSPKHYPDTTLSPDVKEERIESSIPDDEKKYIALKFIQEEKVVQPFDENQREKDLEEPKAAPPSAALSPPAFGPGTIDTESVISRPSRSAMDYAVGRPSTPDHRSSSVSATSLPSTVSSRIAQLEADALHKHQAAELAAANAREVLDQMINARKARRDKADARTKQSIRKKDTTSKVASGTTSKDTAQKEASDANFVPDIIDQLSMCSTLSSDQKVERKHEKSNLSEKNDTKTKEGEETSTSSDQGTNYSAASASQYSFEKRMYYPKTPKDDYSIVSRDSKSSVADSDTSTSTYSTLDAIEKRGYRRHEHIRHRRSSSAIRSRAIDRKDNLFLPSLCTPDSASSPITEQQPMRSYYRSHSASPRHRLRERRPLPAATSQSLKPNHLLPYSPRGARKMYVDPPSSYRETPLHDARKHEVLPVSHFNGEQHPPMAHHFSEVGQGLPRGQYSPSPRMANFRLNVDTGAAEGLQYQSYGGKSEQNPPMSHHFSEVGQGVPKGQYSPSPRMANFRLNVDTGAAEGLQYPSYGGKSEQHPQISEVGQGVPKGQYSPSPRMANFRLNVDTGAAEGLQYPSYGGKSEQHPQISEVGHGVPRGQYSPSPRMANIRLNVGTGATEGLQYQSYGGRSLMPKSEQHLPMSHPRGQYTTSSPRMANITLNVDAGATEGLQYQPYGGRSLTPKSIHEQKRYGYRSYEQPPSGYCYPTTRNIDALSLAQHQELMESMNHEDMSRQRLTSSAATSAPEPAIMTTYPLSYNNASGLPPNSYGGQSITPKSFDQTRYDFRSNEQQPLNLHRPTPRSFDAMSLANHQPYHEWMNSMNQDSMQQPMMLSGHSNPAVAGHYGAPSSMHPFNSPSKVRFSDGIEQHDIGGRPQQDIIGSRPEFLSSIGDPNNFSLHQQPHQQELPFVLH
ncbi:hypothetical protein ACHAWU_006929 [Discostella pseudostelligera]|uniref:Uncharacterized protein n=1 Tax=Discostella pseudostelligera TaxID=259834 RepID=A0ABD3MY36_9STRA